MILGVLLGVLFSGIVLAASPIIFSCIRVVNALIRLSEIATEQAENDTAVCRVAVSVSVVGDSVQVMLEGDSVSLYALYSPDDADEFASLIKKCANLARNNCK